MVFYSSIFLLYLFIEIISFFINIFQSKFLKHIFKVIIYFQLNQEYLIEYSINSSSLNIFSFSHLPQIKHRTNVFSNIYNILGFSNFLYLSEITWYNFFIVLVTENVLVIFYHFSHNHCEKTKMEQTLTF